MFKLAQVIMTKVYYSKIAEKFDNDKYRTDISKDLDLENYIQLSGLSEFNILDLACGTGNYLQVQTQSFKDFNINWYGLDLSDAMLSIAKKKASGVTYSLHDADSSIPYETNSFDYITNNFAFHHFENKEFVLDEIYRVLKPDGILKMRNGAMEKTPGHWIFRFFPPAWHIDEKRYWSTSLLFHELEKRGFEVSITITHTYKRDNISELYKIALNRDISHFSLIKESEYQAGLERIRNELNIDSDASIVSEFALLICVAKKLE